MLAREEARLLQTLGLVHQLVRPLDVAGLAEAAQDHRVQLGELRKERKFESFVSFKSTIRLHYRVRGGGLLQATFNPSLGIWMQADGLEHSLNASCATWLLDGRQKG